MLKKGCSILSQEAKAYKDSDCDVFICGVFRNDADLDHFLERLGEILQDTQTLCYEWVLIPNHFHLLLKTGQTPIATLMRRMLKG